MLYHLNNKKGNITVVLIGLISVMLLMTLALSKRMTGHTQLLTLSDYTQISRYFLESYMSHVMQQVRAQVTDPTSKLSERICNGDMSNPDLTGDFEYDVNSSKELAALAKEYIPNIKYTDPKYLPKISLTEETHAIGYPKGIGNSKKGVEKKGYIEIKCMCEFNKREYTLTVRYPFSVVYRMTPILKDFMLYVDRINRDQNSEKDYINVFRVGDNGYLDKGEQKLRRGHSINKDLKPFILMQPLDDHYDDSRNSGKVYLGAPNTGMNSFGESSDYPVYLNLSGGDDYSMNETFLVSSDDLGIDHPVDKDGNPIPGNELTEIPMFMDKTESMISLPGLYLPMANGDQDTMIGIMGFSKQVSDIFEGNNAIFRLEEFFPPEKLQGLNPIRINNENKYEPLDLAEAMSYSSGLRLMGLRRQDGFIVSREIYGNVLARFMIFSFWKAGSSEGTPLSYDLTMSVEDIPQKYDFTGNNYKIFRVKDDKTYQIYMSRVMSGIDRQKDENFNRLDSETKKKYYMALNIDRDAEQHSVFSENHYNDKNALSDVEGSGGDGFALKDDDGSVCRFHEFGKRWFNPKDKNDTDNNDDETHANVEARIGRTFLNQDSFKTAVGYDDSKGQDQEQNFKVNGVVYVQGDLDLSNGMILSPESCSGGVVLVDGNITLGNIFRKKKLDVSHFTTAQGGEALTTFTEWNKPDSDLYIGPDKILTFVCLKEGDESRSITVKGNALLGVQLVNILDPEGYNDQILFTPKDKNNGLVFYGSIACNSLNLINRIQEFGEIRSFDTAINAPFFLYPPVMSTKDPPLAVQIMENMRSYKLVSGVLDRNED